MAEKEMHKAVCSECGQECEVPFKPDPNRPYTAVNAGKTNDPQEDYTKLLTLTIN